MLHACRPCSDHLPSKAAVRRLVKVTLAGVRAPGLRRLESTPNARVVAGLAHRADESIDGVGATDVPGW